MFWETGQRVTDPSAEIPPLGTSEKMQLLEVGPKYGIEIKLQE